MLTQMRDGSWGAQPEESFKIVTTALGLDLEQDPGWDGRTARSFALDCALAGFNRRMAVLSPAESKILGVRMNEARRLVRGDRGAELEAILKELAMFLQDLATPQGRPVWLTSMNALLPSPYRAAIAACRSTIASESSRTGLAGPPITQSLADRLLTRLHKTHRLAHDHNPTRHMVGPDLSTSADFAREAIDLVG